MEHKPTDIKGYRSFSEDEVKSINAIKSAENMVGTVIKNMEQDLGDSLDKRWLAIGITHLQEGFMAVVRSIAKPVSELKPQERKL